MRTIFYCFVAALALLLVFAEPVSAQVQTRVDVVAVPDRFKSGNGNEPTHGIPNVGLGARVVLKPFIVYGSTISSSSAHALAANSVSWEFLSVPSGSARVSADIVDTAASLTSGLVVYFKPDVAGQYNVQMTVVTDSGNAIATVVINASKFAGVGAYQLGSEDYTSFNCSPCHSQASGVFATYAKTKHASAFARRLSEDGGHFNASCMRCHTASTAGFGDNNGYDDQAAAMSFVFPAHNGAGVYDSLLQVAKDSLAAGNDSLMNVLSVAGIQCESCHGPADEHKMSGDKSLLGKEHGSDVCAPCHFSSDRHPKGYSWENSLHAVSLGEPAEPLHMVSASCARCHMGPAFVKETIKGEPAPAGGYTNPMSIGCTTCHDPHSNEGSQFQLYRKTSRDACTGCHTNRISSRGLHHSHQGMVLVGVDATPMEPSLNKAGIGDYSGWQLPGYRYTNGTHSEIEERCVKCHMAPSPDFDPNYATPDTLLNIVGGHTWRVSWTDINGTHVNNNGCSGAECHGGTVADVTSFVEVSQASVQVLLDSLKANLPLRSPTASPSPNEPKFPTEFGLTTVEAAASYNYYFILNDGSLGVHNPSYARQLLLSSLEQLKLGAGAAQIAAIADFPSDQGKRVQIVWNKFPAEAYSYNPVVDYGVFREDPNPAGLKVIPVKSYAELLQTAVSGQKYSVAGMVWTKVGSVRATNLPQYSLDVETKKDSTATDTSKTSFFIAGYGPEGSKVVYSSQPFAGRSIDNIPPLRVLNFGVTVSPSGATLSWDSNTEDKDVMKYLVYRGTTPTFVPGTALAEVTTSQYLDASATGTTAYWYIVKGVDQAGNIGAPSNAAGTTNVEVLDGVPTVYALGQNYPNPFNPSTTINFSLPEEASVILQVYTISGELVSNIAQGEFPAGNFKATWNGKDSKGTTVATGMYIYRINAGKYSAVKKMVLMK